MAKNPEAYVDTSALIALLDRSDTYHPLFRQLFSKPPKLSTTSLVIAEGQISFPYFSSYWKYRNDIDTVGVRVGCVFTGYSGTDFYGNKIVLRGEPRSSWYVLEEHAQYQHMENDIESIKCQC